MSSVISALKSAALPAWPVAMPLRRKYKTLKANMKAALRNPALFDDALQAKRMRVLDDLVAGKSVAVVGNAQIILDRENGAEIDGHDVVCRFNTGFVVNPQCQGSRTTVHCLALGVSKEEIEKRAPGAQVVFMSPLRFSIDPSLLDCPCVPLSDWKRLSTKLGSQRPSAGLILIDYLLHHTTVRNISLFGFDWKRSKSFYHENKIKDWHAWEAERNLILDWIRQYPSRIDTSHCPTGEPGVS